MMSRPGCVDVGVRLVRRGSYIQIDRASFDDKILACLIEPDPSAPTDAPTIEYETKPGWALKEACLLYTSPSPRDLSTARMPSSA